MYVDTITVFCRKGNVWNPYVLTGVDLNADRGAIIAQYGADSKDTAKLHIKLDGDKIGAFDYVLPKEYKNALSVSDKITFASGNDFTFFVNGAMNTTVVNDEDYVDGYYDHLRSTMDEVYCVTSVARYSLIPHLEILAK